MTSQDGRWDAGAFSLVAVGLGLFAAVIIPGQTAGLNVTLTAVGLGGAAAWARRDDLDGWSFAYGGLAVLLATMFAVHSSEWVLGVSLIVAGGLGVIALTGATSWTGILLKPPKMLTTLHRGMRYAFAPLWRRLGEGRARSLEPAVRGIFLTIFLVGVFGGLFVSADQAFARIAEDALIPEWDLGLMPARVIVGLLVVALAGAYMLVPAEGPPSGAARTPYHDGLGRIELVMALGTLNLLFAGFVAVQMAVLFGGRSHVLRTAGLSYAEYARQGFFQLVLVAVLTLGVIATTLWMYGRREASDRRILQGLLGGLCGMTLVILVSASVRLSLYEETYGFTRLRLAVHTTIVWLAILFVLILIAGAMWKGGWLPRTVALSTAFVMLGLNLTSPDAFIAERNVARFEETGEIDAYYASTLGAEAVPALLELPEPERTCAVGPIAWRLDRRSHSWISFNLAELRARELLSTAIVPHDAPASCYTS
jgi:hypothetical protein